MNRSAAIAGGRPALIIHGGVGRWPSADRPRARRILRRVCDAAYGQLAAGATAMEAVIEAVRQLEDEPLFNAGTGSVLQADGVARMTASVADGAGARFAAVLNIESVRNPALVAAALLDAPDRCLAGRHATRVARAHGFGPWDPVTDRRRSQWQRLQQASHGTVGAVAVDAQGRVAASTSTGGRSGAGSGRVSDSGTPAGNFATPAVAVSCTGLGEDIVDEGLAVSLARRLQQPGGMSAGLREVFDRARARKRRFAAIAVTRSGRIGWATTIPVLFAVGRWPDGRLASF